jgi:1,4-alpha-glucan branching enzyme
MIIKKGKSQVTFVYCPPNHCRSVTVAGSFNDWQVDKGKMIRQKDGSYRKRLQLPPGRYRYKFVVDGQWVEDPQAEDQALNVYGTIDSVVNVG